MAKQETHDYLFLLSLAAILCSIACIVLAIVKIFN